MTTRLAKAALASLMVAVAPVALTEISGHDGAAMAGTFVSGQVVIGASPVVVGFSYANPYLYGQVYSYPVAYSGPLYYYPYAGVYAPWHPGVVYQRYARPVPFGVHFHSAAYYHRPVYHPVRSSCRVGTQHNGRFVRGSFNHGRGHDQGNGRH